MSDVDLWFELTSKEVLVTFMEDRGMSVRALAAACSVKGPDGRKPLSYAMIGHLRRGARKTVSAQTAFAIERALRVPPNVLFQPKVLRRAA